MDRQHSSWPAWILGLLAFLTFGVVGLVVAVAAQQSQRSGRARVSDAERVQYTRLTLVVVGACQAVALVLALLPGDFSALAASLSAASFLSGLIALFFFHGSHEEEVAQPNATDYLSDWWRDV